VLAGCGSPTEQDLDRNADRLQLQRNVGQQADDRDHGDDCCHRLALAIAGGHEVGDRRQVLALRDANDPQHQRRAEGEHDDRAEIDGNEIVARRRRETDAAEKRP